MLLLSSVDLPARALLMNMKQYNGKFGCLYCEDPGVTLPNNSLHRFWPGMRDGKARTHQSILCDIKAAVVTGEPVSSLY